MGRRAHTLRVPAPRRRRRPPVDPGHRHRAHARPPHRPDISAARAAGSGRGGAVPTARAAAPRGRGDRPSGAVRASAARSGPQRRGPGLSGAVKVPKRLPRPAAADDVAQHRWTRYCTTASVDLDIHQLRHAHATELINAGVSIEAVRRRLGHASTETTQLYALIDNKVADDELRAARRRTRAKG
ncbi:tyrosine-type recombinase/integrase [Actinoplanes sp. RD1]|uniref:tyrosine-type recombinase/integrase n=1 Tax=Actinoplanes sp. RD1 TaxID=3064538 RepID=UPI0027420D4C|nr:tyrosine-type recombinase/integrase [Actinoplanes sp. RD1]